MRNDAQQLHQFWDVSNLFSNILSIGLMTKFWTNLQKIILGNYMLDNVEEIFIRIPIFANMCIIRLNRIFPHPHGHP